MTNKACQSGKKRVTFKWWQKTLMILGCTALCVLAAWLLCEKILTPGYVDTVRATLVIEESAITEIKNQSTDYTEDVLDIRGGLSEQLSDRISKKADGKGGRYYILLYNTLAEQYEISAKPKNLSDMISTSVAENDDETQQTIRIRLDNKGDYQLDDDAFRMLVQAAGEQFGVLIFGEPATAEQMTQAFAYRGELKDDVNKNPANYKDEDYAWEEASPADESVQSDVWMVTVTVSKAAIDTLPNRGDFYNRHVDLLDLLNENITDEDYSEIAAAAGVDARPEELRKRISFPMSGEENKVDVEVSWDNGQEEAGKIAVAAAHQAATVIFRTALGVSDPAENQFRYNMDELNGTYAPYQTEVVSKAGAFIQAFYSDRPQFKTDMTMTAQAKELSLAEYFAQETGTGGNSSTFFRKLGESWSRKEFLPSESREAFSGIAGGSSPYLLSDQDVREAVTVAEDSRDETGCSLQITIDTQKIIDTIRDQIGRKCDVNLATLQSNLADGKIDEETYEKAVALLESQRAALLDGVGGVGDDIETSVIQKTDILFFGYADDKEPYRTIRSEGDLLVYSVTETGLEYLLDGCYMNPVRQEDIPLQEAISGLDTDGGYEQILQKADADGPGDALENNLKWSEGDGLVLNISWSDKTTTGTIGKSAMLVLSGRLTDMTAGRPLRLVTDSQQILREQVREKPPATLPTMVIVGLIALIISYIIFSRQPLFDSLIIIFFVIFTFICIFPFYYLFINTISDNTKVAAGRINFLPEGIHLKNYQRIFGQEELGNAAIVTVARTVIGTALMVLTSAWAGYLVTKRKMWHRSFWYRALVITMYFNAGLIPWYTNMLMLGLTNNFLAYIIPGMVAPYNIILVKTYIESIPGSLEESAIIDGASTGKVFLRIILPLSIPILATIAIFGAVGNWNSFQDSLLLMGSAPNLYTLQHRLYIYLNQTTSINTEQISEQMAQNLMNNGVTTKYTIAMVTIIPILLVYPVMQRYFVKGIMLGAVKG